METSVVKKAYYISVYKPSKWILVISICSFITIAMAFLIILLTKKELLWILLSSCLLLIALLGMIEIFTSKILVAKDHIVIATIWKRKKLAFDQISEIKIEDGFIFLVLKKGCVEKMPSWLGANQNLFHRLKIELKLLRGK